MYLMLQIGSIIVLMIHHNGRHDNHTAVPPWERLFFLHWCADALGMAAYITSDEEHQRRLSKPKPTLSLTDLPEMEEDALSDEEVDTDVTDLAEKPCKRSSIEVLGSFLSSKIGRQSSKQLYEEPAQPSYVADEDIVVVNADDFDDDKSKPSQSDAKSKTKTSSDDTKSKTSRTDDTKPTSIGETKSTLSRIDDIKQKRHTSDDAKLKTKPSDDIKLKSTTSTSDKIKPKPSQSDDAKLKGSTSETKRKPSRSDDAKSKTSTSDSTKAQSEREASVKLQRSLPPVSSSTLQDSHSPPPQTSRSPSPRSIRSPPPQSSHSPPPQRSHSPPPLSSHSPPPQSSRFPPPQSRHSPPPQSSYSPPPQSSRSPPPQSSHSPPPQSSQFPPPQRGRIYSLPRTSSPSPPPQSSHSPPPPMSSHSPPPPMSSHYPPPMSSHYPPPYSRSPPPQHGHSPPPPMSSHYPPPMSSHSPPPYSSRSPPPLSSHSPSQQSNQSPSRPSSQSPPPQRRFYFLPRSSIDSPPPESGNKSRNNPEGESSWEEESDDDNNGRLCHTIPVHGTCLSTQYCQHCNTTCAAAYVKSSYKGKVKLAQLQKKLDDDQYDYTVCCCQCMRDAIAQQNWSKQFIALKWVGESQVETIGVRTGDIINSSTGVYEGNCNQNLNTLPTPTLRADPSSRMNARQRRLQEMERSMGKRSTIVIDPFKSDNKEKLLVKIYKKLKEHNERLVDDDVENEVRCEWQQLAMVLDRILFIIYIVGILAILLRMYANLPTYSDKSLEQELNLDRRH